MALDKMYIIIIIIIIFNRPTPVEFEFTRPKCHTRIARRCTALLLPRALPLGHTDRRSDGRTQRRFNTLHHIRAA